MNFLDVINHIRDSLSEQSLISDPADRIRFVDLLLELRFGEISYLYAEVNELRAMRRKFEAELDDLNGGESDA